MKNDCLQTFPVDDQYISTLEIHLTNGQEFPKEPPDRYHSLILNESAVAALGLFDPSAPPSTAIRKHRRNKGLQLCIPPGKVGPVIIKIYPTGYELAIKIRAGPPLHSGLAEGAGKKIIPGRAYISFLDDISGQLAAKEQLLGNAITFFTVLAILLATLDSWPTLFTIERRTKEIGIRKY